MRSALPRLVSLAACAATLSAAASARAEDGAVEFGIGALGAFGGSFLGKPDDRSIQTPLGHGEDTTYPGFGGTGAGVGLMADLRFIKFLGLEIDAINKQDRGEGDIDLNAGTAAATSLTVDIGQSAWHVPVLAKGVLPLPLIAPFVFVGPEFVFPSSPSAEVSVSRGALLTAFGASADNYTMWTGGIGFEFKLPLPGIDLRIPLTFRGSYNPSVTDKVADRATYTFLPGTATTTSITYKSEWQYQALATLGAALYF